MKNNGLPDSKEWDKIIDDAFSSTEQHDFSVRYELKKAEIQKGITMNKTTNFIQRRYAGMVAAAAAIVIAVPVSVYAFSNEKTTTVPQTEVTTTESATQETTVPESTTLSENNDDIAGKLSIDKNGEYSYILKFKPTNEELADTQKYNVVYDFLPEGFSKGNNSSTNFYNTAANGVFEPGYYRVSSETPLIQKIYNIINCENIDTDNINAYILYQNSPKTNSDDISSFFSRYVFVHFKGTNFITNISASDDISDDDLRSIIKGMKLVPSDSENTSPWSFNLNLDETDNSTETPSAETYSTDMLKKLNVGDTVSFELNMYEQGVHDLELTLNKAWLQDNFDGIDTDICGNPTDFSEYLSSDGKIHDTVNWIKYGDGVNTLDETVKTEEVELKVLVLDLTYKNNSSFDFINNYDNGDNNALTICPEIHNFPNNSIKEFFVFDDKPMPSNTMPINNNSTFSIATNNKTGKYSIDILAGKSAHVKMACLVRADQINDTYVDLFGYGCENTKDYIEKDYFFPLSSIK